MNTTRMSSGLAITPEKDLAMFADMASRGQHLAGVAALGHGWKFVDGPPEEAVFDLAYEGSPSADYVDIFAAAGWNHVLSLGDIHIFKAAPGTPPVHSGIESRRDELVRNRGRYLRYAAVTVAVFVLAALAIQLLNVGSSAAVVILTLLVIPVAYTVIPLFGYMRGLHRLDRRGTTRV